LGLKKGLTRWHKYVKARHLILLSDIFAGLEGYFLKEKPSGKEAARRVRIASVPEIIVGAAIQAMVLKLPKNETKGAI
jgi:hypothetical protein